MILEENAKQDWLTIVRKHKKKQKGLPALSKLNPNAGNVEHNVAMFNRMHSGEGVAVNPMNGVTGECSGMGESIELGEQFMNEEKIILEYHNLPVEIEEYIDDPSGYYDYQFGAWLPSRTEVVRDLADYDYEVDKEDVLEVLGDNEFVQGELWAEGMSADEFDVVLRNNFDRLLDKYIRVVKDHFYEDALEAAYEYYSLLDEDYEEPIKVQNKAVVEDLDDRFDMSLRTLL